MKKIKYTSFALGALATLFLSCVSNADDYSLESDSVLSTEEVHIDMQNQIPQNLINQASQYLKDNSAQFPNKSYMAVVDFRPSSANYRFFLVNLHTGAIRALHTSHGNGSVRGDRAYASAFSNVNNSNMTSLGPSRTGEVISFKGHRALRLDGLSSTNSNNRMRGILLHASDGVREANVVQGLSAGCIMLEPDLTDEIVGLLKGGSLIYSGLSN